MPIVIRLTELPNETSFAPLGVLGYCLTRVGFLAPVWAPLQLSLKAVDHTPEAKLQDLIVSVLAGCRSISQVNTLLRPDVALAQAWRRPCFADQSTIARTLDAFTEVNVTQLRQGSEALFRQYSCVLRHNFERDWLWADIDLTPLPISKYAEGSTKGKFGKKTAMVGNWLACMHPSITRPFSRGSTPVSRRAVRPTSLCWTRWELALV